MSTLRAILEVQGCLDTAVVSTQDPRVMEVADAFLPRTSANADWYREIQAFFFPRGIDGQSEPNTGADPLAALNEIQSDWLEDQLRPTAPQSSRFIYGLAAVVHLINAVPDVTMPFSDPFGPDARPLLGDVFALTGGHEYERRAELFSLDQLDAVEELFVSGFNGWQDWYGIAQQLVGLGVLTADAASVPLCNAAVINYKGIEAVVVDAELKSDQVSLDALKAVVDPRNWHEDDPSFFCSMVYKGLRPDHWRRVLETVGFCGYPTWISPRLVTMLKFYKTTINGPDTYQALLDYDLNDPTPGEGDGKIDVDNGFIDMRTEQYGDPSQPPVLVRVRKVCHINGLRPYTQKRFVCMMGYAFTVEEMLFGSAQNPDPNAVPWDDPANEQPGDGGQQQGGQAGQQPPDNSVASTAISMVAQCVQDLAAKQYDLADKWMSGQLTAADLAEFSAEVGARIASDPWKFIQAISQPKGGGK
ncbi:hypothetical protein [Mycobacterium sp.]|uniref:hypothetical protein n=1 Tax=Mycobacterium sp. TaxID=1785 RepID=UPI002B8668E3|nr:hypothetical protein [Mycobacterium sp.]HTY32858.1 hypothetical protein [Mycobacterium sp.]